MNELYLELSKIRALNTDDRSDRETLLGLAAHIMRRLLLHHARPLHRHIEQVELSEDLALEAIATARMAEVEAFWPISPSIDPQLRASQLNCPTPTVDRRWAFARKWLEHQLVPAEQ